MKTKRVRIEKNEPAVSIPEDAEQDEKVEAAEDSPMARQRYGERATVDRRRKPKRNRKRRNDSSCSDRGRMKKVIGGWDETGTSYRRRVRSPGRFTLLRTISLTDGVSAVVGRLKGQTKTVVQSVIFNKARFKSKGAASKWLKENPRVSQTKKTVWMECACDWLPLSGEAQPFVIHATFNDLPYSKKDKALGILAKDQKPVIDFRFGTDRFEGFFGFRQPTATAKQVLNLEDMPLQLRQEGPGFWLDKDDAVEISKSKGKSEKFALYRKTFTLDRGEWRLNYATPNMLSISIEGQVLKGDVDFIHTDALGWMMVTGLGKSAIGDANSWVRSDYPWVVAPNGIEHEVIDVAEELGKTLTTYNVVKSDNESRYTLGVVYPAHKLDAHKDFATTATVEKACWGFLANAKGVGLYHKDGTDGAGQPVESYIYRGPDWTFQQKDENGVVKSEQIVKAGDWLMGVVWSEKAWDDVKSGRITGYSLQGWAKRQLRSLESSLIEAASS